MLCESIRVCPYRVRGFADCSPPVFREYSGMSAEPRGIGTCPACYEEYLQIGLAEAFVDTEREPAPAPAPNAGASPYPAGPSCNPTTPPRER